MSDPLTGLFGQLRDEPPPAPFAPAQQVRRRGRQRSLRTAATAMAAVVVTGVGSAAALAQFTPATPPTQHSTAGPTPGTPTPTTTTPGPTPSGPPSPATVPTGPATVPVPASALLAAAEVGPGVRVEPLDDLGPDGPEWLWAYQGCPDYRAAHYPSVRLRGPFRIRAFARGGSRAAGHVVERYPSGAAATNMADIRRFLVACASFRATGPPLYDDRTGMDHALELVDSGLAGDESLLIRHTSTWLEGRPLAPAGPPAVAYHLVVRRGDLVATVTVEAGDEALARRLASRVAGRLG